MADQGVMVAGLKLVAVKVAEVKSNAWNPNKMNPETFAKELRSIREHGFVDPITVRELSDGSYEIVDGEHRWRAAQELGIEELPATNLGRITDHQAKKLTILYNELKGNPEPALLADVLKDLAQGQTIAELSLDLPMTAVEIDSLIKASTEFTWDERFDPTATAQEGEGRGSQGPTGAEDRKFAMGNVRGSIPVWLVDQLMEEFNRSVLAVRTKNPETVLRDWVERLKKVAPEGENEALAAQASRANEAPAAKGKRGKKKEKVSADHPATED